jgi:hypothetical protein
MTGKHADLAGEESEQFLDSSALFHRAKNYGNAGAIVNTKFLKFTLILEQVDLVYNDHRRHCAVLRRDEIAVNQAGPQRRGVYARDDDNQIHVRCERSLVVGIVGIGPGQNGSTRKRRQHPVLIGTYDVTDDNAFFRAAHAIARGGTYIAHTRAYTDHERFFPARVGIRGGVLPCRSDLLCPFVASQMTYVVEIAISHLHLAAIISNSQGTQVN